ncbi:hypothetical protein [Aureimonas psammosilenae]|uniref:hypothetical protein n=1 Tax=Aureimonas psammosilenae TaxID=2495496 RepID=UPI00126046CD|nr:hypothetical protein [Aureimonas psammosilenae]
MAAEIRYASEFGPGHAWLICDASLPAGAEIGIANESETNRHLGPAGWQAVPASLPFDRIEPWKNGSRALLRPAIVDRISDSSYVTITLGSEEIFADFWPSIPQGGGRSGQAGGVLGIAPQPTSVPQPIAALEPEAVTIPAEPQPAPAPERQRSSWLAIGLPAAAVVLLLGFGAAAAYHWRDDIAGRWNETLDSAANILPAGWRDRLGWSPAPEPAAAPAPVATDGGDFALGPDGWRRLVSDPQTEATRLYDLGRALREQPNGDRDLGFQALYAAMQRGDAQALAWYGRANDPTLDHPPADAIEAPNIRRALEAYKASATAGNADATASLSRLCDHLRPKRFAGTPAERTSFQDFCS